jgi:hypothetical protein
MKKLAYVLAAALLFASNVAYARGGHGGGSSRSSSSSSKSSSSTKSSSVHVKGYTTKSGKYVEPHYRSAPNKTQKDNYSTKGNVNPYTGKKGTKKATR